MPLVEALERAPACLSQAVTMDQRLSSVTSASSTDDLCLMGAERTSGIYVAATFSSLFSSLFFTGRVRSFSLSFSFFPSAVRSGFETDL